MRNFILATSYILMALFLCLKPFIAPYNIVLSIIQGFIIGHVCVNAYFYARKD